MKAEAIPQVIEEIEAAHGAGPPTRVLEITQRLLWLGRSLDSALDDIAVRGGVPKRGDYEVLALMYRRAPELVHPKQIARELDLSTSGVTGRLDRLEGLGLLSRSPDAEDRRALRVSLTDRGRELTETVYALNAAAYVDLTSGLSDRQMDQLSAALATIHANLDEIRRTRATIVAR